MKPFQIFRTGRHTDMGGTTLSFGDADLEAAVANYDPALHQAPIVVGHPKDNHPAYGWVKGISFADGAIVAEPEQLDPEFSDMVQAGRFKTRSASFYLPDSPNNPKPGALYLRHVGFLGAQPPAVKGLKPVEFAEVEGVIEFSDAACGMLSGLFRGLRELLIEKFGREAADSAIPSYQVDALASMADDDTTNPAASTAYTESATMTEKEALAAAQARTAELEAQLAAEKAAKAKQSTEFSEREAALVAREAAAAKGAVAARVDAIVKAGKLLPKDAAATVDFAMTLADADPVLMFGEGAEAKVSQREAFLLRAEAAPKVIELGEFAPTGKAADPAKVDVAKLERSILDQVSGKTAAK
jgi:hypothetical protein